jgi:hypothetical protein
VICLRCGSFDGWHAVSCALVRIPPLGLATMRLTPSGVVAFSESDEMSDCAAEGFAATEHPREAAA